jgi:phospholipid/cholesterol/gamma-HCH transport system permease protein
MRFLYELGALSYFYSLCFLATPRVLRYTREILHQWYRLLWGTAGVVAVVGIFVGANVVVQGVYGLKVISAQDFVAPFVGLAIFRELGPILTAAMIAAKAGGEITGELSAKRLREELSALEVMGVNPIAHLALPRILGTFLAFPILSLISLACSLIMATIVAVFQFDLNPFTFTQDLFLMITLTDLFTLFYKGAVFSLVLSGIQCYSGFTAPLSPQGVGLATNRSVVASTVAIGWVNLIISGGFY